MSGLKHITILLLLAAGVMQASGQKSRVLAVFQMIDQKKYTEAKEAIELAAWNDKTSRWPRTYYAKGLLCQTAYEDGYKAKDVKKTGVYPDQLYVGYYAYEKAMELDARERLYLAISQNYYHLSNDFRQLGKDLFLKQQYEKALRAFEHALMINNSKLINAPVDTSLVFNTAMAAYESENWEKTIGYLTGLHDDSHNPSTSLLLHKAHVESGDSARAREVLLESLENYNFDNQVVVYLINLLNQNGEYDLAIEILDEAIDHRPENYRNFWSRGLIYQRMGAYDKAIESLKAATEIATEESKIPYHIGVIYYNQGIDLRDQSLTVKENADYQKLREQSRDMFLEAVEWLEKSYDLNPFDENTISRLYQLYSQLQMREKGDSLRPLIE